MIHQSTSPRTHNPQRTRETCCETSAELLNLVADEQVREIIAATAANWLTVTELEEQCPISTATMYRKVEAMVDADLLAERLRLRRNGRHVREYRTCIDALSMTLTVDESIEMTVECEQKGRQRETTASPIAPVDAPEPTAVSGSPTEASSEPEPTEAETVVQQDGNGDAVTYVNTILE